MDVNSEAKRLVLEYIWLNPTFGLFELSRDTDLPKDKLVAILDQLLSDKIIKTDKNVVLDCEVVNVIYTRVSKYSILE
jgi:predicted transcriptional regulator